MNNKFKFFKQKFEIAHYLKKYEEKARKLLNYYFPEDNRNCYTKTTFITWEVTLEKIKQNKYGQQALEVLETKAYLAPDNIPINIFLELGKGEFFTGDFWIKFLVSPNPPLVLWNPFVETKEF
jgi:hypothetical protein